jgi:type I restriction enzyme M protein
MEKIEFNIDTSSISGGLTSAEQEMENKLEAIFSSTLDALRGAWDLTDSANVLLTLIFYKRIMALVDEGVLSFIKIDEGDYNVLHELNKRLMDDRSQAFKDLRYALINIARQNPVLENIFAPLVVALEHEGDLQHLVRVFWMLEELDFSTQQFPVNNFGAFFNNSLNRAAARAGKSRGYWTAPRFLNKLLAYLINPQKGSVVFDPTAGHASTLIEMHQLCPNLKFIAKEKELNSWALSKMNFLMNGIYDAEILQEQALLSSDMEANQADLAVASFPFGIKVETRLVKNRPYISIPFEVGNRDELGCNSLFVQLMLHKLKSNGRMAIVLPITALFRDGDDRKMREYLIRRDWVEAVVTLPHGMLYSTGAPICIMIVNKAKPIDRKEKIVFINASNLDVGFKSRMMRELSDHHIECIVKAYREFGQACEDVLQESVAVTDIERVIQNDFNLNAKRYAAPFIHELERLGQQHDLVQLRELFLEEAPAVWVGQEDQALSELAFVRKEDVALSFGDYPLVVEKLKPFKGQLEAEGRLLKQSALLVNRVGARLRISYFNYQGQAILISKKVMAFGIRTDKIQVEYLILQMHQPLFFQQLQTYRSDHEEEVINEKEFGQLQIVLPSEAEQAQLIRETKIQLIKEEESKVETLRHRLNLGKQEAQNRQARIISSLHHELGNRLPALLTEFKNLKDYLVDKSDLQEPISLDEPIFPIFEGEDPKALENEQLGKVIKRLENILVQAISTIDAAGNIISADKGKMHLEYILMRDFLEELASIYANDPQFAIQIEIEEDDQGKELAIGTIIDKVQLTTALTNLIENAKRHGFVEQKKYLIRFKVGLSQDKEEVIIEYKNDGKAFPDSFTFEDFISYGNYAGDTGHSGIGGYLINQIVENHEGSLSYRGSVDRRDPFKVQFELVLPHLKHTKNG